MTYHYHFSLFDKEGQRKYLNQSERKRFFEIATARDRADVRLFNLLLYYTGARISEIHNLTPLSLDFSNRAVTIQTLKRRRTDVFRQIPLPNDLLDDLKAYLDRLIDHPKHERLWRFSIRSASRYVKAVMLEAGVNGSRASALGLRHGFAVHGISLVPITQIQRWLGHANLNTTSWYLNICGHEERQLATRLWR